MNDVLTKPEPDSNPKRPAISPIACDEVLDLIPALALGAIETASAHLVRQHCERCVTCADVLTQSERVTAFLPFAAPLRTPSSGAKLALMDRIAAPVPAQAIAAVPLQSPIVDSPADKRRAGFTAGNRSGDLFDRTREFVAGQGVRLAAAPIALALVLVSLYSLGTFDDSTGAGEVVPTAQAAAPAVVSDEIEIASEPQVTLLSAPTSGALATLPSTSTNGTVSSSFMARSSRLLAQTEPVRSVAPKIAECSIEKDRTGTWHVDVTGVSLVNREGPADVFLISTTGELVSVGGVDLDSSGNGTVSFKLDRPLSDFSFIQIGNGPVELNTSGSAGHMVFHLNLADRLALGLGRPD